MSDPQNPEAAALRYLARREYSRTELRQKLLAKGFPEPIVDDVLAGLVRDGYLSDDRFADSYARSRASRGFGPLRIRQELRLRGLEPGKDLGETDWDALIQRVYTKKYGTTLPATLPERAARQRFLAQRGFGHDEIAALFRRLKDGDR